MEGGDQSDFNYIVRKLIYFSSWLPTFCNMRIDLKCELGKGQETGPGLRIIAKLVHTKTWFPK